MLRGVLSKTRFQELLRLARKKERTATGAFFVEGWRWLDEALALPQPPLLVLATPDAARTSEEQRLLDRARRIAGEFIELTPEQLGRLTGNVTAPGVAALVTWRPLAAETLVPETPVSAPALVVALDTVGDPGNAGTIVRTADWFGASGVVFGAGSVDPTNPKAMRATMGSLFHLPVATTPSLESLFGRMREAGFATVGAALDGVDLPAFSWPARAVLVIGNEARGIRPELASLLDARVRIPRFGRAESLNASVAAAVLMAAWRGSVAGDRPPPEAI